MTHRRSSELADDVHLLEATLGLLNSVPMELENDGTLVPLTEPPEWLCALTPWCLDNFALIESVLPDFEDVWAGKVEPMTFGPWEHEMADESVFLEVRPLLCNGCRVIVLSHLGEEYRRQEDRMQRARENLLVHDALRREIEKKEFLLHTIVHDLIQPLTTLKGVLDFLGLQGLPEGSQELLQIGSRATQRQETMITQILEVFEAEINTLNERQTQDTADPKAAAQTVTTQFRPAFLAKGVELFCQGESLRVRGDEQKLERVLSNLVDNGLRVLDPGKSLTIRVSSEQDWAQIEVFDDGPGVEPEFSRHLFKGMAKGRQGGGKIGLGLYFCKLTVEAWGGQIAYRTSETGGACFFFRLPLAA